MGRLKKRIIYQEKNGKMVPTEQYYRDCPQEEVRDYHDNDVQGVQDWIENVTGKKLPTRIAENGQEVRPLDHDRKDLQSLGSSISTIWDCIKGFWK